MKHVVSHHAAVLRQLGLLQDSQMQTENKTDGERKPTQNLQNGFGARLCRFRRKLQAG